MMKVTFRTDASLQIGTGHVMRCLTLASALKTRGAECEFICRAHDGNLVRLIQEKGYTTHTLPVEAQTRPSANCPDSTGLEPTHSLWLGATQSQDADACGAILAARQPDWLIVDHYSLDARWESKLSPWYDNLMVVDDLADRPHTCDLLLDQSHGRAAEDYTSLVPDACRLLCGPRYALLRPEFAELRPYSLQRRVIPALRELLITMGGVDKDNITGLVLQALRTTLLPADCRITVILGTTAPWQDEINEQAQKMPWRTRILVGVSDMAQLMADSDLAIGAAGATSLERCCLGVPTIMLVLAENQRKNAQALDTSGAAHLVDTSTLTSLPAIIEGLFDPSTLGTMSAAAAKITDGLGVARVIENMANIDSDHK